MEMHWHWLVIIYLFLGGIGAGAYLTSFAAEKGWLGTNSSLTKAGYYLAAPAVAFGTLLLVFDLGQGFQKPLLLVRLLLNFQSVMTWGVYILSAFILISFIKAYLSYKKVSTPNLFNWAGAVLALATAAYTGLLLWAVPAIPFWSTAIMPVLFVVSALSTGFAAADLLVPFVEKGFVRSGRENQTHMLIIIAELIVVAVFFGAMLAGLKGPAGTESARIIVTGNYALIFWVLFIGLGLLFPIAVNARQQLEKKTYPNKSHRSYLHMTSDASLLLGGFILRAMVVLAAVPIWDGLTI